jgi:YjbE family integral membrane protein
MDSPVFWLALGQIIWINIILSGDNAVVIALAARSLPPKQQRMAILWGSGAAVVLRIILTFIAAILLKLPYLQLIGGALLLWIGFQLMGEEGSEGEGHGKEHGSLAAAVRTILIADLVMSLDNVIAVALAAKGDFTLLVLGLAISIPLVIFGSTLMIKLMERFPIIVTLGAALIGWVAGDAITHDVAEIAGISLKAYFEANPVIGYAVKAGCAVLVVVVGRWLASRGKKGE